MNTQVHTRTVVGAGAVWAGLLLAGCASPVNQRTTIGAGPADPDGAVVSLSSLDGDAGHVSLTDAGPSVSGIDRSGWTTHTVLLPVDHTEHHASFSGFWLVDRDDAVGAAYPTLDSALGVDRAADADLLRWIAFPFGIVRDGFVGLTRLGDGRNGVAWSPRYDAYERTP